MSGPRRVLITGGAGFIGANLAAFLAATGDWKITVVDDESLGDLTALSELDINCVRGSILNQELMSELLNGTDVVVHLAADTRVMDSINDPDRNFEVNVVGTYRLLSQCRAAGIARFVNASTGGAILGEQTPPIHENLPAAPIAPYGASKLAAEGYCTAFAGAYGLSTTSLRFSNIYGPGSFHKGSVVAAFFKQILTGEGLVIYGDGTQRRDYLFVGDLVGGIRSAMEANVDGVLQLGSGRGTSLEELIAAMRNVVGDGFPFTVRHEDFRQGEIHSTWCDIRRAQARIGFDPLTPLADGLAQTWRWFRENTTA